MMGMCYTPYGAPGPLCSWIFSIALRPRWGLDDWDNDEYGNRIMDNDGNVLHTLRGAGTDASMVILYRSVTPMGSG